MILKIISEAMDIQFIDHIKQFTYSRDWIEKDSDGVIRKEKCIVKCLIIKDDDANHQIETADTVYLLNDEGKTIEHIN